MRTHNALQREGTRMAMRKGALGKLEPVEGSGMRMYAPVARHKNYNAHGQA